MSIAWEFSSPELNPHRLREQSHHVLNRVLLAVAIISVLLAWPSGAIASPVLITLAGGGTTVTFTNANLGQSTTQTVTLNVDSSISLLGVTTSGDFSITDTSSCSIGAIAHPAGTPG